MGSSAMKARAAFQSSTSTRYVDPTKYPPSAKVVPPDKMLAVCDARSERSAGMAPVRSPRFSCGSVVFQGDTKGLCRSDQIAAFGEGGPHCQNACGVRRKIGAVCRYGCCALCQLFRRDGGYDGEQHGTFNPSDLACFAARAADVAARA